MQSAEDRNRRHARTDRRDERGAWYRLDNAAIIMPAVTDRRGSSLFRLWAELDSPVVLSALRAALKAASARFPFFNVELRRGFFWYYLEPREEPPLVYDDLGPPCMAWDIRRRGTAMYRVRARGSTIACEMSHIIADGYGGAEFFKALLAAYAEAVKDGGGRPGDIRGRVAERTEAPDDPELHEDAYHRYYRPGIPIPDKLPLVYHIASAPLDPDRYRVLSGELELAAVRAAAKARGASVTEFLAGVYLESLLRLREAEAAAGARVRPLVSLEIPVNLRKHFPSRTCRNFSLFLLPTVDARLGPWTLEELIERIRLFVAMENRPRSFLRHLSRNAGGGRRLAVRLVPLFIKNIFARMFFYSLGEGLISSFISNLGPLELDAEAGRLVRRIAFVGAPSALIKTHASVTSYGGVITVSFGSLARSRELERLFFTRLAELGLAVRIRQYHGG
jgi:hypothetical protein